MQSTTNHRRVLAVACACALLSTGSWVAAGGIGGQAPGDGQGTGQQTGTGQTGAGASAATATGASVSAASRQEATAAKHVNDAVAVAQRMLAEPRMKQLLQQAKGVFIVPTFGRAALGVGASGGAGVLLVKRGDGTWSDPAFYNIGGIDVGAQIGAEGGAIAMVLNNDKAVSKFTQKNTFALNAAAGLTVVNWAKIAQGSLGDGDIVAWAGTKGLYGNLVAVGVSDIRYNENLTNAYYHQRVSISDAVAGKFSNPQANTLKQTLAASPALSAQ